MKKIYLLPSFFTLGNIFCGFYSIISSINDSFTRAAYVILIAILFDVFDGKIARATNSTSKFGVEFDSLADLISFGMAPGILAYLWTLKPLGRLGWLAAFLFLVCGALRLARFNVQVDTVSSDRFVGLPIPAGAGMIASTVIFHVFVFGPDVRHPRLIVVLVYALAVLMVSNIKYRNAKNVKIRGKNPFKIMVVATLILIFVASEPQITFFLIGITYVTFGLLEAIPGFSKFLASYQAKRKAGKAQEDEIEEDMDEVIEEVIEDELE